MSNVMKKAWAIVKNEMGEKTEKALVKEVKFGKGIARITVTMWNSEVSLDGWKTGTYETHHTDKVEIVVNGNVVASSSGSFVSVLNYNDNQRIYKAAKLNSNKKYTKVGDKAITEGATAGEEIKAGIKEMKEELAKEFGIETEEQKEAKAEKREAKAIVEAAEKEGIEKLMSAAEIKKWRKRYNDLYNEGGEGYVPQKISRESYEWALKVLNL